MNGKMGQHRVAMVAVAVLALSALLPRVVEAAGKVQPTAPTPSPASVAAVPQQTTATFGDWTLRCVRPAGAAKQCEVMQLVQQDGKPVAQIAIGSIAKGQAMQLTILVPPSVTLATAPLLVAAGGDGAGVSMAWRRCLPGGCVADGELGADALPRIAGWKQAGRIVFTDGAGRSIAMPLAPQGLTQALDALASESVQ